MLLDTSLFVDYARAYQPTKVAFDKLLNCQSASVVTKLELITGLRKKSDISRLEKFLEKFEISVIPITEEISQIAESIIKNYYHSHGIGIADSFIAATSIVHNEE